MTLLILGDSHGGALRWGLSRLDRTTRRKLRARFGPLRAGMLETGLYFLNRFHRIEDGGLYFRGNRAATALLEIGGRALPIRASDDTVFGFCFGLHIAHLMRDLTWKNFTLDPTDTTKFFVSDSAYRDMCLSIQSNTLNFFRDAKAMGLRFFVLAAPPIREDFTTIYPDIGAPADVLAKVNRFREIMVEEFGSLNIPVVFPPSDVASGGFLRPWLAATRKDDAHHANYRYGILVWRHIAANMDGLCAQLPPPPPVVGFRAHSRRLSHSLVDLAVNRWWPAGKRVQRFGRRALYGGKKRSAGSRPNY